MVIVMSYIINRLDDYGRGITNINGKTCFVVNALPNEEVDIEILNEKKNYIEAVAKVIKEDKKRKKVECPFYLRCGGCNIMHMGYETQLRFKEDKIKNILLKFSRIEGVVESIISSNEFNYRNKVILKVKNGKLGFYKDKSNDLVVIDKCLLCKNSINKTINLLNKLDLSSLNEILIRSNYKDEILLCLYGNNINVEYFSKINVSNLVIIDNNKKIIVNGNDYIIDKIGNKLFKISMYSFFQVNYLTVEKLYNIVYEYSCLSGKENVLDLYCGTGTIGTFLSEKAKNVFGIEINRSAINDANFNKKINNVNNINFLCSDVGLVKKKFKNIDLVVIDPPRSGLSKSALDNVLDIMPQKIIYVSCNPITLARDLNVLKDYYMVKKIRPVDMFPNTYHVETVSVLCHRTIEK